MRNCLFAFLFLSLVIIPTEIFSTAPIAGSGYAINYDGSGDYISCGTDVALRPTAAITVETWINVKDTAMWVGAISNAQDNGVDIESGYHLSFHLDKWKFFIKTVDMGDDEWAEADSKSNLMNSGWNHIAGTYDGSRVICYLNGLPTDTVAATGDIDWDPLPKDFRIGSYHDDNELDTNYFNGMIDEVRIWKTALTHAEIQNGLYSIGDTTNANLIANWRFDENTGTTALDATSTKYNGTITNATYIASEAWKKRSVNENTTLTFLTGYDLDFNPLTISTPTAPNHGGVSFNSVDNSITYVPSYINNNVTDNFTFQLNDGTNNSNEYAMSISVINNTNNPPVAGSGDALTFDGVNDYISIPEYKGITGGNSRTCEAWIKGTSAKADKTILSWGTNSGGQKWVMRIQDDKGTINTLRVEVNGGHIIGSTDILDNKWHHVACVLTDDGSPNVEEMKLYVDGQEETISAVKGKPVTTAIGDNVKIGNDFSNRHFEGCIDEVRIWSIARTLQELQNNRHTALTGNETNLVGYWRLDEGSGDLVHDFSSGRHHGFLQNSPVWVASDAWSTRSIANTTLTHSVGYDPDAISLSAITGSVVPANGTLSFDVANRTLTYSPNYGFNGIDKYTYLINDGNSTDTFSMSISVTQTLNDTARITTHPHSDTVATGSSASFIVTAIGNPVPQYKWLKDGILLPSATDSVLNISSAVINDIGLYRGIAWNTLGSDTSNEAHLQITLNDSVVITSHAISDTVLVGQEAMFGITASGLNLTYQWQKFYPGSNWTDIDQATSDTLKFTAKAIDDKYLYHCIVTSGTKKDTSNDNGIPIAQLTIALTPTITTNLSKDTAIGVGGTMTIYGNATGTPSTVITWYKKDSSTTDSIVIDTGTSLTLSSITKTDKATYFFIARNKYGKIESKRIIIHIIDTIAITTNLPENYYVGNGANAIFTPTFIYEGDSLTYIWYKNDTIIPGISTSSYSIDSVDSANHDHNAYSCKATNYFLDIPISTISTRICTLVISPYCNPFRMKVERLDIHNTTELKIKLWSDVDISNFPTTKPSLPLSSWADSIWVFHTTNMFPVEEGQSNVIKNMFSTENIKLAKDTIVKIIKVNQLKPGGLEPFLHDNHYWFNFSVRWHNPKIAIDTLLMPLTEANKVYMMDTTAAENPLVVHGQYITNTDSILLILDNLSKLIKDTDSLVVIQCSKFSGFNPLIFDTSLAVTSLIGLESDTIIFNKFGTLPIALDTMHCQWYIVGTNKSQGIIKNTTFEFGMNRPVYNGTLIADSTFSGDKIHCNWDAPVDGADSIRIWWDANYIPLDHDISLPIVQAHYIDPVTSILDTIGGLNNNRLYHLGLQIFKNGMWSSITKESSDSAKTSLGDTTRIPNIIAIDTSWFDTLLNQVNVKWHLNLSNMPDGKSAKSGFTHTLESVLDTSQIAAPFSYDTIVQDTNLTTFSLHPDICFDTSYTVGIWLLGISPGLGAGQPSPPMDSSIVSVKIPSFTWQQITIFKNAIDTVFAINNKLTFINLINFEITDTIWKTSLPTPPNGFVIVGGISFNIAKASLQIPPFKMGIRYDSLPTGITANDLAMYNFHAGNFNVRHNSYSNNNCVWDSINSWELADPFLILADTMPPKIIVTDNSNTVKPYTSIPMYFGIKDNSANVHWDFLYGPGHDGYLYSDTGDLTSQIDTSIVTLIKNHSNTINSFSGVRALIIASDGVSKDTVNVSLRVYSDTTGIVHASANEWLPMRTTATLNNQSIKSTFEYSISDKNEWVYDTFSTRLYRWYDDGNKNEIDWVEYSDATKDSFDLVPGRLIWYKSAIDHDIIFGSGATTSLREPYEIVLNPGNWTDISLPFQFPIMLRDILEETGEENVEMLEVYHWEKSDTIYNGVQKFLGKIDSIAGETDTIYSGQKYDGYTVYNHKNSPIILKIPPTSLPLSRYSNMKRKITHNPDNGWQANFMWKKAGKKTTFKPIRCGYKPHKSDEWLAGPLPPSMNTIKTGVYNRTNNHTYGWAMQPALKQGGVSFEVAFTNTGKNKAIIEYYVDDISTLPKGYSAKILNSKTNKYENVFRDKASSIEVGANETQYAMLAIGTKAYIDNMAVGYLPIKMLKTFPNPFRGKVTIQYRLPLGISEVQFTLYNLRGQQIFMGVQRKNLTPGRHLFHLKETKNSNHIPFSAGVYIMRMTAKDTKGKMLYGGKKKLTCVK